MYKVVYKDDLFWISKDDVVIESIGGFIDCITPKLIIQEIENEI